MKKYNKNIITCLVATILIAALISLLICTSISLIMGSGLVLLFSVDTVANDKALEYIESIENQENSNNFFHMLTGEPGYNLNCEDVVSPKLKSPTDWLECNYFGATDKELFYYIETDEGIEFYKSNYTDYTYEMTRSFKNEEILYHKCDKLIYLGEDGKTYIFDGFDLTDKIYQGEIPTYTQRYTVIEEENSFIIRDTASGKEKNTKELKKTFRKYEQIKDLGLIRSLDYVFVHDNIIYIVYSYGDVVVTFEFDFDTEQLTMVNWGVLSSFDGGLGKTWYLDRVKFAE